MASAQVRAQLHGRGQDCRLCRIFRSSRGSTAAAAPSAPKISPIQPSSDLSLSQLRKSDTSQLSVEGFGKVDRAHGVAPYEGGHNDGLSDGGSHSSADFPRTTPTQASSAPMAIQMGSRTTELLASWTLSPGFRMHLTVAALSLAIAF